MKVGIFGGSFDPIHYGHIRLAQYVLENTDLDEIWLMVAPLNPLKPQGYVASDEQRLEMARLAVAEIPGIRVSDFEFSLPIPSYTYNTLLRLKETYPEIDFRLIIGGDNWAHFDSWRNPQEIIDEFGLIVYPRPGEDLSLQSSVFSHKPSSCITILKDAPQMPVSSTQLRSALENQSDASPSTFGLIHDSVHPQVMEYIEKNGIYLNR
ncbi:MAG: nicotinate (nicotinamide) nucleotide adenylyltransferase [Muribaculaceae bacterium]|nr:nicotinate (nicotinamide) nucleotide adenylyltransferase [Muribaculaceae bacterium]